MPRRPHPEDPEAIGGRVEMIREALKLAPSDFARKLGVSPQSIYQWENAIKRPGLENALAICRETGATLDFIYRGRPRGMPDDLLEAFPRDRYEELTA